MLNAECSAPVLVHFMCASRLTNVNMPSTSRCTCGLWLVLQGRGHHGEGCGRCSCMHAGPRSFEVQPWFDDAGARTLCRPLDASAQRVMSVALAHGILPIAPTRLHVRRRCARRGGIASPSGGSSSDFSWERCMGSCLQSNLARLLSLLTSHTVVPFTS